MRDLSAVKGLSYPELAATLVTGRKVSVKAKGEEMERKWRTTWREHGGITYVRPSKLLGFRMVLKWNDNVVLASFWC